MSTPAKLVGVCGGGGGGACVGSLCTTAVASTPTRIQGRGKDPPKVVLAGHSAPASAKAALCAAAISARSLAGSAAMIRVSTTSCSPRPPALRTASATIERQPRTWAPAEAPLVTVPLTCMVSPIRTARDTPALSPQFVDGPIGTRVVSTLVEQARAARATCIRAVVAGGALSWRRTGEARAEHIYVRHSRN